jgi:hypothetical protein
MRVLAFLQNQWFRNPAKVQHIYERHPELRNELIARFLFSGCLTGRRLREALGDLCDQITWEETSPLLGDRSGSQFPADLTHMQKVISEHRPELIICFGKVAGDAIRVLDPMIPVLLGIRHRIPIYSAPHPASRDNPMSILRALATELRGKVEN